MQPHKFEHKPFVFEDFTRAKARVEREFVAQTEQEESKSEPVAPAKPAAPTFSLEALQEAEKKAEEIGFQKGREQAQKEQDAAKQAREEAILQLLQELTGRMDEEVAAAEAARVALRGEVANIALLVARKLVGNALEVQPLGGVEEVVDECLTMLAGEGRLTITVSADAEAPLKAYLERLPRDGQVIEVKADSNMQTGDCRIQWPGGKAERSQKQMWQEIEAIVMRALSMPASSGDDK